MKIIDKTFAWFLGPVVALLFLAWLNVDRLINWMKRKLGVDVSQKPRYKITPCVGNHGDEFIMVKCRECAIMSPVLDFRGNTSGGARRAVDKNGTVYLADMTEFAASSCQHNIVDIISA